MRAIIEVAGQPFLFFPTYYTPNYNMYDCVYLGSLISNVENTHNHSHVIIYRTTDRFSPMILFHSLAVSVSYMSPATPELVYSIKNEIAISKMKTGNEAATYISIKIPDPKDIFNFANVGAAIPYLFVPAEQLSIWRTRNYQCFKIQTTDFYQDPLVLIRNVKSVFNLIAVYEDGNTKDNRHVNSFNFKSKIIGDCVNIMLL